ncbi:ABC transporter substrate-binding protein [Bradyrhizobium liaoningense]|uniref:ABC transporter substrate-binding protein n=1 Tax=Bradyrhizobium liaoningense TaxID=43992 RepID=UPI001BA9EA9E|nr:ABC transporter substrate-binding protein [Bradyrhizobium liaoningense]MBR0858979.1 ABC transporter substrate-binding protein [Bradyrhizobium liaoningense]
MQLDHLKRRELIGILGFAAAWPRVARGQIKPAIVGVLGSGSAQSSGFLIDALKEGMKENGFTEGREYVLDVRWAEGDYKRFAALVAELLERKSRVIVVTTIAAARAAQQAAPATPIVMAGLIDPVGAGLIASLARPGNNTTGVSSMIQDVSAKGLELIREIAPTSKAIAVLFNPNNPGSLRILENVRSQAAKLGMTIQPIEFKGSALLDATLEAAVGHDALLVVADSALLDLRERIAGLALRHRLPTFSSIPEFTDGGALVGYGPSRRDSYRRAATYVKKVLEGAKPADIPVEQPTLIGLSINLQTARALGIVIPDALLARAERLVE